MLNINSDDIEIDWESGKVYVSYNGEDIIFSITEDGPDLIGDTAVVLTCEEGDLPSSSFNTLDYGGYDMSIEEKEKIIKEHIIWLIEEHYQNI